MASPLNDLNPKLLWKHFAKILTIPHCSGNEKALGDYVLSVAASLGLPGKRDRVGNVLVAKPATSGREGAVGAILQGHLDMVCEKNSDKVHDFCKDPIQAEIKGEWVYAQGTTLGADNGIGLAACLAVMEDKTLIHGPLEFLFTVEEETGLDGANKIQKGFLAGKMLLNLDSEDEGTFTIGCAGGADSTLALPLERKKTASKNLYKLHVHGLRGGHSGLDINQGRGNAIKLLARMLGQAQAAAKFEVIGIEGGSKHNAIPREAVAMLACPPVQVRTMTMALKKAFDKIKIEYKAVEPGASYTLEAAAGKDFALTQDCQRNLIDFLLAIPHGVIAMHPEIAGPDRDLDQPGHRQDRQGGLRGPLQLAQLRRLGPRGDARHHQVRLRPGRRQGRAQGRLSRLDARSRIGPAQEAEGDLREDLRQGGRGRGRPRRPRVRHHRGEVPGHGDDLVRSDHAEPALARRACPHRLGREVLDVPDDGPRRPVVLKRWDVPDFHP